MKIYVLKNKNTTIRLFRIKKIQHGKICLSLLLKSYREEIYYLAVWNLPWVGAPLAELIM